MAKYAKAGDVRNNSRDIGDLIRLQKEVVQENRREYLRSRIDKLDDAIISIELKHRITGMPSGIKRYYERLKTDRQQLVNQLK